jgi:hypothetical protein
VSTDPSTPARLRPLLRVPLLLVLLPLLLLGVLLSECSGDDPDGGSASDSGLETAMGHIHGLGVDPADGVLYAAAHFGVFRLAEDSAPERVADRWQDTMAFTVIGPSNFLASGHPDLTENLPAHLGLIETTNAALTWQPVSLEGIADFHALDVAGGRTFGYDAVSGWLLTSTDQERWKKLTRTEVADLAADPSNREQVLATGPDGDLVRYTVGRDAPTAVTAPPLVFLDWPAPDLLVGVGPDGEVFRSRDAGGTWNPAGVLPGAPGALDVVAGRWYAATEHAVYESVDEGASWGVVASDS